MIDIGITINNRLPLKIEGGRRETGIVPDIRGRTVKNLKGFNYVQKL